MMWPLIFGVHVLILLEGVVRGQTDERGNHDKRVLVLGAGMSGISAAKVLHDQGYTNLLLMEGSDRIGGRLKEGQLGNFTVELGGTWIYGIGKNVGTTLAERYNLSNTESIFSFSVRDDAGKNLKKQANAAYDKFEALQVKLLRKAAMALSDNKPDYSIRSALSSAGWIPSSGVDDAVEFIEYDSSYALPPEEISAKYSGEDYKEEFVVTDKRGYSHIIRSIAQEFLTENDSRLHLSEVVEEIERSDNMVTVRTNRGSYTCDFVVVTFSIGVLQHREVKFTPALPEWKLDAIDQFQMALMLHVHMQFPAKFWDDEHYIVHVSDRKGYFTLWRNVEFVHPGSRILHAMLTGKEAHRLSRMKKEDVVSEAVAVLQKMYGSQTRTVPQPIAYQVSDWLSDPLFRGSYSNWPPGYTMDTYHGLIAPVGPVYFAGEYGDAISSPDYGYVHTAFTSGAKVGASVAACIEDATICEKYKPVYASRGCRYSAADNYDNTAREDDGTCSFTKCATSDASGRKANWIAAVFGLGFHFILRVGSDW